MSKGFAVITTIRQGSEQNSIEKVRAEVFLDTATVCFSLGIPLVAVFKDCSERYLKKLNDLEVILVPQSGSGIGYVRREAIKAGIDKIPGVRYYLWLEPEKPSFPIIVSKIITDLDTEFCFFNRHSMNSYLPEQACYYLFCRWIASQLIGFDVDYAFGPMILTKVSARVFLEYEGEYGDLWDSILIPRLRIIRGNIPYEVKTVEFHNDPRMTAIESGILKMFLKRIEQFRNVIPALITEWKRLT